MKRKKKKKKKKKRKKKKVIIYICIYVKLILFKICRISKKYIYIYEKYIIIFLYTFVASSYNRINSLFASF